MKNEEKQKVLDVLNNLEVFESNGGEDAYILVEKNPMNQELLFEVGVSSCVIDQSGDEDTFCILALAFNQGYADDFVDGKLIVWDELVDDDLRYRVLAGEGTPTDAERLLKKLESNFNDEEESFPYFIHYTYSTGSGMTKVSLENPIETYDQVKAVNRFLDEQVGGSTVIVNWIPLKK